MHNNRCEKSVRRKKDGIILSPDKESVVVVDSNSNSKNAKVHRISKSLCEMKAEFCNRNDKNSFIESFDDVKSKSISKISVKMNSFIDNKDCEILSSTHYKTRCLNGVSKLDKSYNHEICSCTKSSTQIFKCKAGEAQLHVSIKNKRPVCCNKIERQLDVNCQQNNCSLSLTNDTKILKLDLLLHFLDQMRQRVITQDLSFDAFRSVSERLIKDKMNIELLLLTELVIRAQVIQMTKIISKDLCQNKITPKFFVTSFLKQYQFLKSLSLIYKDILDDYETKYLTVHKLSIDLISRAYFKRLIHDCPIIKQQIVSGHLNVKLEHIIDSSLSNSERSRIKMNYATLKSDFQDTNKWRDVDKTIRNILDEPDEIINSLVNHCFSKSSQCKKEGCDRIVRTASYHTCASYSDILGLLSNFPENVPLDNPNSFQSLLAAQQNTSNNSAANKPSQPLNLEPPIRANSGSIYQALDNIKAPSITCSSSSNNSNGYNSCLSISSYEESSDEDEYFDHARDERFFQEWKRKCDTKDKSRRVETKPTASVLVTDYNESVQSNNDDIVTEYKKLIFCGKDRGGNQDEIEKFDKLYEQYLAENEHLLEKTTISSSATHMSVPDYLSTLEKADNLQSIIKILMAKYKKNIDIQEKISRHPNVNIIETELTEHTACTKQKDDKMKEDDFEIDFEELSHTFGVGSTTRESLEEFEKFLDGKLDPNKGKTHPNLQALVTNCRLHCNKLYKPIGKEENRRRTESESSDTGKYIHSGESNQTISGHELFDLPLDCSSTVNIEIDNCMNNNIGVHNNNMSSSETGSSSASTENTNNNKVCNCCKCEMFGEQSSLSGLRATNVREKLRLKLQKRKQCTQKPFTEHTNHNQTPDADKLPDVDTLVEFINGSNKTGDVMPQTPDVLRFCTKKNKQKTNKSKPRKTTKTAAECPTNKTTTMKTNDDKQPDLLSTVCLIADQFSDQTARNQQQVSEQTEGFLNVFMAQKDISQMSDKVPDKEIYDPVVEDFKRFCSNVVVPKHRKKLQFNGSSLMANGSEYGGVSSTTNSSEDSKNIGNCVVQSAL